MVVHYTDAHGKSPAQRRSDFLNRWAAICTGLTTAFGAMANLLSR